MELLFIYLAGLPFSFYLLSRWLAKETHWLEDSMGLQAVYMSLLWPFISLGVMFWYAIEHSTKAIESIGKPFLKAFLWCASHPKTGKELKRFGD